MLVLDPMLATGGSMEHACRILAERNAGRLTCVCILSAPEGLARLEATDLIAEVVTASIDSASTTSPTSSPASATPATASSAPPESTVLRAIGALATNPHADDRGEGEEAGHRCGDLVEGRLGLGAGRRPPRR